MQVWPPVHEPSCPSPICRCGPLYTSLQPRVSKALFEALAPDKPWTTQYGAIVGPYKTLQPLAPTHFFANT